MTDALKTALVEQVNRELHSAYLYLGLSSRMKDISLDGFANWLRVQAEEEMAHATHMYDYLQDRVEHIDFPAIPKVDIPYDIPPTKAVELTLQHERYITESINKLIGQATAENDFASVTMLQWYVMEQIEEESTVKLLLDKTRMAENNPSALLMIDAELATRTFVDPFANASSTTTTNAQ